VAEELAPAVIGLRSEVQVLQAEVVVETISLPAAMVAAVLSLSKRRDAKPLGFRLYIEVFNLLAFEYEANHPLHF
jgi:hypothetical protein